jgi:VWFA-related protein
MGGVIEVRSKRDCKVKQLKLWSWVLALTIGVFLVLELSGCGCGGGGGPAPSARYGSIEGYVYVPETTKQPIKATPVLTRVREQAPPGYIPVEGATVYVEGTDKRAVTDAEGYFKIEQIPVGQVAHLKIVPPENLQSLYDTLYIDVPVENANSTVPVGTYGAVSLPSVGSTSYDVVINYIDFRNYGHLGNDPNKAWDIEVGVQIIDSGNKSPVIGITKANLALFANDRQLGIINVLQPPGETSSPAAICLVLDRSGSMAGQPLEDAKEAAKHFVSYITSNDMVEVISFSGDVEVIQAFTNDKQALYNAIDGIESWGSTALYDAIWKGLDDTATMKNYRKAVVVLTDGGENASSPEHGGVGGYGGDSSKLIAHAKELGIPVYTIGLKGSDFTREKAANSNKVGKYNFREAEQDLQKIALQTGGEYFLSPTSDDLYKIYTKIAQRVYQQYKIQAIDTVKIFQKDIPGDEGMKKGMYGDGKFGVNVLVKVDNFSGRSGQAGLHRDFDMYEVYAQMTGDGKIKVYGEDKDGNPVIKDDHMIGQKYWGSTGVKIDESNSNGMTMFKIAWNNNEKSDLKPVDVGWVDSNYVWRYDIQEHLRGLDISKHNISTNPFDWGAIYKSGRRFVIFRLSVGARSDYDTYESLQKEFKNAVSVADNTKNFYIGIYHACGFDNQVGSLTYGQLTYEGNPEIEANNFISVFNKAKEDAKVPSGYLLLPALDLEMQVVTYYSNNGKMDTLINWIAKWMKKVHDGLNLWPMLYTSESAIKDYGIDKKVVEKLSEEGTYCPILYLWVAKYSINHPAVSWSFWQYAGADNSHYAGRFGRCPGLPDANSGVDLDIFNGDVNDLSKFLIQ